MPEVMDYLNDVNHFKLLQYLVLVAENPALITGSPLSPVVVDCWKGLRQGGLIHLIRLVFCLKPLIEDKPFESKPPADLKLLFMWNRRLLEARFANDPDRMRQVKETCEKLEGMFLSRWELICDEKGWRNEPPRERTALRGDFSQAAALTGWSAADFYVCLTLAIN